MKGLYSSTPNAGLLQLCKETIAELIAYGLQQIDCQNATVSGTCVGDTTYCVGSTLHRGAYYPSPVYDLIVGNNKRGRVVRQAKNNRKITHRYLYDNEKQLHQVEHMYMDRVAYIETLFRNKDTIFGVTVDNQNRLAAVTREVYQDQRLRSFVILNCCDVGNRIQCYNYLQEDYDYDADGLCGCRFVTMHPENGSLSDDYFAFERVDGYLSAYKNCLGTGTRYLISKKRKA